MDIESKIWTWTRVGTKKHAFINGVALCRKNITRDPETVAKGGHDYLWAKSANICDNCEAKFNAGIERLENSLKPSTGEGDYLPPAEDIQVSAKMHEDLMYAANFYGNAYGKLCYSNRRTEDALLRRGLITYDITEDNYPVITVKGWAYLASKGFNRRAEDPGRSTLEEALSEAYAECPCDDHLPPAEAAQVGDVRTDRRGLKYRVSAVKRGRDRSGEYLKIEGRCIEDKPFGGNATSYGAYCCELMYATAEQAPAEESPVQVSEKMHEDKEAPVTKTNPKITPEMIKALRILRNSAGTPGVAHQRAMKSALDILDNAGIFSAIDEATGYDVDPEPEPISKCTCPQPVWMDGSTPAPGTAQPRADHYEGCPGDPAEWGDMAYTTKPTAPASTCECPSNGTWGHRYHCPQGPAGRTAADNIRAAINLRF